jgi:hypothetical protein
MCACMQAGAGHVLWFCSMVALDDSCSEHAALLSSKQLALLC